MSSMNYIAIYLRKRNTYIINPSLWEKTCQGSDLIPARKMYSSTVYRTCNMQGPQCLFFFWRGGILLFPVNFVSEMRFVSFPLFLCFFPLLLAVGPMPPRLEGFL
ncbi:hypothetical protein BDZ91DRAFT_752539 [Kalaharituber pfeilii]|nr:hypothetical protein BDZ91DRAFT_752539 [Kalaharituber pfeilii]